MIGAGESAPEKRRNASENIMKKSEKQGGKDELRREYDLPKLRGGVRGKYVARYRRGTNLVLLSPDVAECQCGAAHLDTRGERLSEACALK